MKNGDFSKAEMTKKRIVRGLCNRWLAEVLKKNAFCGAFVFRA